MANNLSQTKALRSLDFSDTFVICAGTVTINEDASKVLILYHEPTSEYLLPKGHKNIGETLEATAERETYEETGYRVYLVKHKGITRATNERSTELESPSKASTIDSLRVHSEPIAVQQRIVQGEVRKIIFWFLASVKPGIQRDEGTQDEGENFEPVWIDIGHVIGTLSWEDDRSIVQKALELFK